MIRVQTVLVAAVLLYGCATPGVVSPPGYADRSARDAEVLSEIRRVGRNGDWLVIRGYHPTDHLISVATNTPWSHAAVLDLEQDQVIEAEAQGVHTSSLLQFVAKSHRVLVVRPAWATRTTAADALLTARALVGKRYDFLGLIGFDVPDRFYCSELAVAVYKAHIPASERIPRPVAPSQLHYWGRILYDSGTP